MTTLLAIALLLTALWTTGLLIVFALAIAIHIRPRIRRRPQ